MRPLFICLILCVISSIAYVSAQDMRMMQRVIEKNHYSPKPLDDAASAQIFDFYLNELDEDRMYLTAQDIQKLEAWKLKLDDEVKTGKLDFVKQVTATYISGYKNAQAIIKKLSQQPINFDTPGNIVTRDSMPFASDAAALTDRWSKYFAYLVLEEVYDNHSMDSVKPAKVVAIKEEASARKSVADLLDKRFSKRLADTASIAERLKKSFFDAIATYQDPHTEFFAPEEKKEFDESLSSERMMFGIAVSGTDDGYEVTDIVPGSPAWNSGDIHVTDKIIQVKSSTGAGFTPGKSSDQDLHKILDQEDGQIELTVQSADGKTSTVKLQKELIRNDENFVKGYVLSHGEKKTGYIALPSFYEEWNDVNAGSSCANDVSKEIVKLKREGIDALLLDLRYNGGGSLQEAIELSGIFIDAGPLCIIKETGGESFTLKDPSRGTIYNGPLGVMINGQSASASELVAGALQDYNRAVVIGGNSFGKATMQVVLPMDSNFNYQKENTGYKPNEDNGFVKVTTGKLYRISGSSNQLNGVAPDVALPDPIEVYDYTERKMPFALPSDTTMKKVMYTAFKGLPLADLAVKSRARVDTSGYFRMIKAYMAAMKKLSSEGSVPLQWDNFLKWKAALELPDEEAVAATGYFTISNSTLDNRIMQLDAYQKELNDDVKNGILTDPYVEEALKIMEDLVNTTR